MSEAQNGNTNVKLNIKVTRSPPVLLHPAGDTPDGGDGTYFLSNLDQNLVVTMKTIYCYTAKDGRSTENACEVLRTSLEKVLTYFYPFEGRFGVDEGGKLVVRMNGGGVPFVEAVAEWEMEDLGDVCSAEPEKLGELIYFPPAENIFEMPLLTIQVGGVNACSLRKHYSSIPVLRVYMSKCSKEKFSREAQRFWIGKRSLSGYDLAEALAITESESSREWILDSGCSFHMRPHKYWFESLQLENGGSVLLGDNKACRVVDSGTIKIKMFDGAERILQHVRYVPELKRNLICLGMLESSGYSFKTENCCIKVSKGSLIVMKGVRKNGLDSLVGRTVIDNFSNAVQSEPDRTRLWYMKLGHVSERDLQELSKQSLLCGDRVSKLEFCEQCVLGKATRMKFSTGTHSSKKPLDYVHSDLWGPARTQTHGGGRYFMPIIDDYTRKVWVFILKSKDEAFQRFRDWLTVTENKMETKLKHLRTDNGLEYCSEQFEELCRRNGITRHKTVRNTPQQNGWGQSQCHSVFISVFFSPSVPALYASGYNNSDYAGDMDKKRSTTSTYSHYQKFQSFRVTRSPPVLLHPAGENPAAGDGTYFLSNLDQNLAVTMKTINCYAPKDGRSTENAGEVLKTSLEKSTREESSSMNGGGVPFVEAVAECEMEDLGDVCSPEPEMLGELIYFPPAESIFEMPLLTIQVTRFKCGGFVLGMAMNHSMADGLSAVEFLHSWAAIATGRPLSLPPFLDRSILTARRPPAAEFPHPEFSDLTASLSISDPFSSLPVIHKSFTFDAQKLSRLKLLATANGDFPPPTTFAALTGLVWRARTKALNTPSADPTKLLFAVDCRKRLNPPLPVGYFGNGIVFACCICPAGQLVDRPLANAVRMVQTAARDITDRFVRSAVDYFELTRTRPSLAGTLMLTDWTRLGFGATDFGWGCSDQTGPAELPQREVALLLPLNNGGKGTCVVLGLPATAMGAFEDMMYF
ncbi:uncharacterized protein LOC110025962 [Phalaenopsis equestris]|uniref:uncharacterized protein LOC110025962 n=1 Tax=Phalaenopsis equestris TaxID=78828 RepID=UPI0009E43D71|nr:uncharacterized protein LOC110025962 [Phalaenopsis equestris]